MGSVGAGIKWERIPPLHNSQGTHREVPLLPHQDPLKRGSPGSHWRAAEGPGKAPRAAPGAHTAAGEEQRVLSRGREVSPPRNHPHPQG